jgi:hypothetical protein
MVHFLQIYFGMLGEFRVESESARCRVLSYGLGEQRVVIKMVPSVNSKESQLLKN